MATQSTPSEFAVLKPGRLPAKFACHQELLEAMAQALTVTLSSGNPGRDVKGDRGLRGYSAYEVAVQQGFAGTAEEWLDSLNGEDGIDGLTLVRTEHSDFDNLSTGATSFEFEAPEGVTPQSVRFWLQSPGNVYINSIAFSEQRVTISFSAGVAANAKIWHYYETFDYEDPGS